jgi:hypothetical protein
MSVLSSLADLLDRPETLTAEPRPAGLGRAAMLGYAAGTLGGFVFLRLFAAVPPGVLSYLVVLTFVLAANFLFSGMTHLFMDLTGAKGGAGRLFLAFGLTDYFFALLVPLALFSKLGAPGAFLSGCLVLALVVYARVRLIRRLYPVSANKALLSVLLPYAAFCGLFFLVFGYSVAWLVWLVV